MATSCEVFQLVLYFFTYRCARTGRYTRKTLQETGRRPWGVGGLDWKRRIKVQRHRYQTRVFRVRSIPVLLEHPHRLFYRNWLRDYSQVWTRNYHVVDLTH